VLFLLALGNIVNRAVTDREQLTTTQKIIRIGGGGAWFVIAAAGLLYQIFR
jgi:hypothetical protein